MGDNKAIYKVNDADIPDNLSGVLCELVGELDVGDRLPGVVAGVPGDGLVVGHVTSVGQLLLRGLHLWTYMDRVRLVVFT